MVLLFAVSSFSTPGVIFLFPVVFYILFFIRIRIAFSYHDQNDHQYNGHDQADSYQKWFAAVAGCDDICKNCAHNLLLIFIIYMLVQKLTVIRDSTQTRSRSLPHATVLNSLLCSSLSAGVFQWSAYKSVYTASFVYIQTMLLYLYYIKLSKYKSQPFFAFVLSVLGICCILYFKY